MVSVAHEYPHSAIRQAVQPVVEADLDRDSRLRVVKDVACQHKERGPSPKAKIDQVVPGIGGALSQVPPTLLSEQSQAAQWRVQVQV